MLTIVLAVLVGICTLDVLVRLVNYLVGKWTARRDRKLAEAAADKAGADALVRGMSAELEALAAAREALQAKAAAIAAGETAKTEGAAKPIPPAGLKKAVKALQERLSSAK